jgi:O-antigen ligase
MAVVLFYIIKLAKRRMLAGVAVPAALTLLMLLVPNPLLDRLKASGLDADAYDAGVEASNRTRMAELEGGLRMIAARPLTGVGLGNFETWMDGYGLIDKAMAHNTYVQIGAELGLPALFAFLLVVTFAYRSLGRAARLASRREEPFFRDAAVGIQVGLAGFMAAGTFVSAHFEKYFWLVLFLTIAVERVLRMEQARVEPGGRAIPTAPRGSRRASALVGSRP